MKVLFSHYLKGELDTLDEALRDAIDEFIFCVTNRGIKHLKGRNKSSAPPNPHTKKEHRHAKFAQKYCLWHRACLPFIAPFVFGDISEVK